MRLAGFADIEDPAHRRVRDLPREPDFLEDARRGLTGLARVHQLERHGGLEHQVVRSPDVAHAAAADARDHPVAAGEHVARGKFAVSARRVRVCSPVLVKQQERCHLPQQRFVLLGTLATRNASRSAAGRARAASSTSPARS